MAKKANYVMKQMFIENRVGDIKELSLCHKLKGIKSLPQT